MICENNVCGTGGWNGPKPGDPSNNSVLTATPAFGGIDLRWSFPTVNPFAVAHTRVFRGIIPDFAGAIVIADPVGGSFYYDKVPPPTEYFYWIQFVSINGTYGEVIGPASAVARSSIEDTIEQLTGMIDAGMLAQALKTEIARISEIDDKIFQEITDRLAANVALSNALAQVQDVSDETLAFLQTEITQRQDADDALVSSINTLFAQASGNAAAINEERLVRVSKDDALASRIDTLAAAIDEEISAAIANEQTARVNADAALAQDITTLFTRHDEQQSAIINEQTTRANADTAMAQDITELYAAVNNGATEAALQEERNVRAAADGALAQDISTLFTRHNEQSSAIQSEQTARINADGVLAQDITTLYTKSGQNVVAVQDEATARINADSALGQRITNTESAVNGNIAQAETRLQTNINTTNNKVTSIGALYTAKVTVNGLIGGFGVYNDGTEVQAGFDVDMFWIGRTAANKRKPFIVVGSEVFIDQAVINQLTFTKLRDESGAVIVENGKLKAEYLEVGTAVIEDLSVTTAKIADAAITTAKIGNAQITNAKIGSLAVDTLNIAGNAVTIPVSAYTAATYDFSGTANTMVTVQSVAINSSGSPIALVISAIVYGTYSTGNLIKIFRGETEIYSTIAPFTGTGTASTFCAALSDTPGVGNFTYYLKIFAISFSAANRSITLLETKK